MLKKWTKSALFAATAVLVLAAGTFTSCSDDGEVYEEIPEFDIMDGILQSYNGTGGDVTIPDDVRIIGNGAFATSAITSVVIPSSVKEIQSLAFWICSSLKSVTLPASVTEIADDAFDGCGSIENLTYTGTLEEWCSIQNGALQSGLKCFRGEKFKSIKLADGTDLKTARTLEIPMGVTAIADYVFHDCWQLESVTIPASATFIGSYAFSGCSLLESVTIPTSVKSIGSYAFSNCSLLESITIPAGVTYIAPYAFKDCQSLKSVEFKSQDNWSTSFDSTPYRTVDVSEPSENATNLRNTTYPGWGESGLYKRN